MEPFKEYIGQTKHEDFQTRLNGHVSDVKSGLKRHLYNAIRKYGWENFTVTIIHNFPREGDWEERLDRLETLEISQRKTLAPNGYNNETGGNRNKTLHEDTKALMSQVRSGENHAMFGKHHSEETRGLLREANNKQVQQWSKDTKTIIRTFESIEEASRESGADASHISKICNRRGRLTAGGFHWKFVNDDDTQANENIKFKKIQQWSFDGSTLIEEFDSIKEASEKTGADAPHIGKCCKGKGRSAGGFKWKIFV